MSPQGGITITFPPSDVCVNDEGITVNGAEIANVDEGAASSMSETIEDHR